MFKLSFAAALLVGASAVATDAKTDSTLTASQVERRNIDYLNDVASLPTPTAEEQQRTLDYWAGDAKCTDIFTRLIALRTEINSDITEYRTLVEQYDRECKLFQTFLIILYRCLHWR
jgi:hypothetical protein